MSDRHDKLTIISMAVITAALASALHEGVGHGMVAWMRGDVPTELTSNHLSTLRPDKWVDAGGTLVNLFVGTLALAASMKAGNRANLRYFLWLIGRVQFAAGRGIFHALRHCGVWRLVGDHSRLAARDFAARGMATFGSRCMSSWRGGSPLGFVPLCRAITWWVGCLICLRGCSVVWPVHSTRWG